MEYKFSETALFKKKQRAASAWIITLQIKHFFCRDTNFLAEFFLMKNNICAHNPQICHVFSGPCIGETPFSQTVGKKDNIKTIKLWKTDAKTRR